MPRESTSGTSRTTSTRFRAARASTATAATSATASTALSPSGSSSADSAITASATTARGAGVMRVPERGRAAAARGSSRDRDVLERGADGAQRRGTLELGLRGEDEPVAQDRGGHAGHVVGRHVRAAVEARRGLGRPEEVHGGAGRGTERDRRQLARTAHDRDDVVDDLVVDLGGIDLGAGGAEIVRGRDGGDVL